MPRSVLAKRTLRAFGFGLIGLFGSGVAATAASVPHASDLRLDLARSQASTVVAEINTVRAKFHLPLGKATTVYQGVVDAAARGLHDPVFRSTPTGVLEELGVWGFVESTGRSPLDPGGIVNAWVYKDGWQGALTENVDCTSPSAPGCDDHRRYILSGPPAKGSHLSIDVAVVSTQMSGNRSLSVVAILSWSAPVPVDK